MYSKIKVTLFISIFLFCISLLSSPIVNAKAAQPTEENDFIEDTDSEGQPEEPSEPSVIPPSLSKSSVTIAYGKAAEFPKVKDLPLQYEITYTSSNSSIAAVDKSGTIKGKGIGKCKIYAVIHTDSSEMEDAAEYKLTLNVSIQCKIKTISFSYLESSVIKLGTGQKRALLYTVSPKTAIVPPLEFHSSHPTIASVSKNGLILAKKAGKTKLTVSVKGMKKNFASVIVKVAKRSEPFIYSMKKLPIVSTAASRYTYQSMVKDLNQLQEKYGDRISVSKIGSTYDNRNLYEIKLGNPNAKKHIFISSSMHAREYMASLLTMKQLEYYCFYYYTGKYKGNFYSEIFNKVCVHINPMVNPDGISISQFGAKGIHNATLRRKVTAICKKYGGGSKHYYTTWKANARGVDLNRNFDIGWKRSANQVKHPAQSSYKGTSPSSEKETKAVIEAINRIKPKATINYHAMGSVLYWYFGQTGSLLRDSQKLLNEVRSLTCYTPIKGKNDLSNAAGLGDWASIKKKLPTITIEIGRSPCPLKISEFPSIWNKNREIWAAVSSLYY